MHRTDSGADGGTVRDLHVVALSEDGRHVVLATRAGTASGEFRVVLDERLVAAVRGELPAPGRDAPPSISPREIQARLRDGEAPEDIAASAGVPLSRVERYAGPVLAELDRMITGARTAVVTRPRLGASALPLGEAVEAHLAEVVNLAEGSVRWSARRADLGQWVVSVSWTARGRRRTAGWRYDPTTREVTAVDGPSAVLGHVEAQAAPAPAAGRAARPAARSGRSATRTDATTGASASSTGGRAPRRPAAEPASAARTSAQAEPAAQTAARTPAARTTAAARPVASAPTPRRRAAPPPTPPAPAAPAARTGRAAASAARPAAGAAARPAAGAAAQAASARPATARPAAARPAERAASTARPDTDVGAASASTRARGTAATGRPAPRRAAARRSTVPPLDEVSAVTATSAPSTTPAPAPTAASASALPPAAAPPAGPPVLRVVPPTAPDRDADRDDDAAGPAEAAPVRRAAGQRAGGRDWADVLMGTAPAAEQRQD